MKSFFKTMGGLALLSLFTLIANAQTPILADTQHQFTYDANGNRIKREQIAITVILRNANPDSTKEETTAQEQNFNDEQAEAIAQQESLANGEQAKPVTESSAIKGHQLFLAGHTINAYPNPVSQQLNLEIAGLQDKLNNLVRIYEMNGRLISETRLQSSQKLDFSSFSAGTYLLTIWIDGKKKEVEIIKY
jgi:hypothetical protein